MKKLFLISISCFIFWSCNKEKAQVEEVNTDKIDYSFTKEGNLSFLQDGKIVKIIDLEFAETSEELQTGLMYRPSMEENQGMIFINNAPQEQTFYMKNTQIALDLLYISPDSLVVDIQRNAKPLDESIIPSDTISQYVLEVNAGMAAKWNIQEGKTKVRWEKQGNSL